MKYPFLCALAAGLLAVVACSQPSPPPGVAITPVVPTAEPAPAPTLPPARPTATQVAAPDPAALFEAELDGANQAYSQADFSLAAERYRQALQIGPEAAAGNPAVGRLEAFAAFRLGLAELLARNEDEARQVLQEQSQTQSDEAFRQMAFQLWDAYAMTGDPVAACSRVSAFAQQHEVRVESGTGTSIEPNEICEVPEARPQVPDQERETR